MITLSNYLFLPKNMKLYIQIEGSYLRFSGNEPRIIVEGEYLIGAVEGM